MQVSSGTLMMLMTLGLVVAGLTIYYLIVLVIRLKKAKQAASESSPVGFVVDTFHGLVMKLKEKESELDALRKKAEEKAGVMEDYNAFILESVPSGVVSMNPAWGIVTANTSAERILGQDINAIMGRDGREVFAELLSPAPRAGGETQRGSCWFRGQSGRRMWLGFSVTPLRNAEGATIGRLMVLTDLTELKALEEQAELRTRLASLGEMAAGIAHELRNPMSVISGYMRMLGKSADESQRGTVDAVNAEVNTMNRIIEDFLNFARPREMSVAEVDLGKLAAEAVEKTRAAGGAKMETDLPGGLMVMADEVQIRQALINLITNALDATPEGGTVRIIARRDGDHVAVVVEDTGHGIDQAIMGKIFNPFFTTKDKGTGLGLAIVHRVATSHGGGVKVECPPEGGTRFTVTLKAM